MDVDKATQPIKAVIGGHMTTVSPEELQEFYHLPAGTAAAALGMSLTTFKKRCRNAGLQKWPYNRSSNKNERPEGGNLALDSPLGMALKQASSWQREREQQQQPQEAGASPSGGLQGADPHELMRMGYMLGLMEQRRQQAGRAGAQAAAFDGGAASVLLSQAGQAGSQAAPIDGTAISALLSQATSVGNAAAAMLAAQAAGGDDATAAPLPSPAAAPPQWPAATAAAESSMCSWHEAQPAAAQQATGSGQPCQSSAFQRYAAQQQQQQQAPERPCSSVGAPPPRADSSPSSSSQRTGLPMARQPSHATPAAAAVAEPSARTAASAQGPIRPQASGTQDPKHAERAQALLRQLLERTQQAQQQRALPLSPAQPPAWVQATDPLLGRLLHAGSAMLGATLEAIPDAAAANRAAARQQANAPVAPAPGWPRLGAAGMGLAAGGWSGGSHGPAPSVPYSWDPPAFQQPQLPQQLQQQLPFGSPVLPLLPARPYCYAPQQQQRPAPGLSDKALAHAAFNQCMAQRALEGWRPDAQR